MASSMRLAKALLAAFVGSAVSERMAVRDLAVTGEKASGAAASGVDEAAKQGAMLADQVSEGSLFLGRFRMKQALWAKGLHEGARLVPLPAGMMNRFQGARELQSGSFGETWAAIDTAENNRPVALKLFYDTAADDSRYHLTWAHAGNNPALIKKLSDAAGECLVAQKMQYWATSDPVGASRLMQCYEDHVTCPECLQGQPSGTSTSNHRVMRDQPLYQVLEDCAGEGGMPLAEWYIMHAEQPSYLALALQIFREIEEAIQYLTEPSHSVKWTHHDLKPENIVIKLLNGRPYTKLIDFGSVTAMTPETEQGPAIVSTVSHAPVEWKGQGGPVNFDLSAPWSYDTYSAGVILYQLLSGQGLVYEMVRRIPEPTKAIIKQRCNGDEKCELVTELVMAKQQVEPGITKDWASPFGLQEAQRYLFAQVQAAFVPHASAFLQEAGPFLNVFIAMMALDPRQRPPPSQVLGTPYMQVRASIKEPQFDEAVAQRIAQVAFKNSEGGVPPEQVPVAQQVTHQPVIPQTITQTVGGVPVMPQVTHVSVVRPRPAAVYAVPQPGRQFISPNPVVGGLMPVALPHLPALHAYVAFQPAAQAFQPAMPAHAVHVVQHAPHAHHVVRFH